MEVSKLELPPEERTIGAPDGGWTKGVYLVEVAFASTNIIHSAILCAPFIRDGKPRNETLLSHGWGREHRISDLHYLRVVKRSDELSDFLL